VEGVIREGRLDDWELRMVGLNRALPGIMGKGGPDGTLVTIPSSCNNGAALASLAVVKAASEDEPRTEPRKEMAERRGMPILGIRLSLTSEFDAIFSLDGSFVPVAVRGCLGAAEGSCNRRLKTS
jgi:hypothetical protein